MSSAAKAVTKGLGRKIAQSVKPTPSGPIFRLIGTVDIDGKGTNHALPQVDPFMLLDYAQIPQSDLPTFGAHPHRGHSVVTLLLQGQEKSWDSFTQEYTTVQAPASYWVDAGSGIFHDEVSVVPQDDGTPVKLFQLWISVKEEDRLKPASLQYDTDLPVVNAKNDEDEVVGSITYFVGGENTKITTPHPIVVVHVQQKPNAVLKFPVDAGFGGFLVHMRGGPTIAGEVSPEVENEVLVLADSDSSSEDDCIVIASKDEAAEYMICAGETINEQWYKKLVANGAVIAQSEQEARDVAAKVETYAAAGKSSDSCASFAPFGV